MPTERFLPRALRGRPLLGLALALVCGILLCSLLRPGFTRSLILVAALCLAALLLCVFTRFTRWQPLLMVGVALGFFLCAAQYQSLSAWPVAAGDYAEISGRVMGVPVADEEGYRLRLRVALVDGAPTACADIYVYGQGLPPLPGSRVTVSGRCRKLRYFADPGAFDYGEYLAQQGIAAVFATDHHGWLRVDQSGPVFSPASLSLWLRDGFSRALSGLSPEQQALVKGVFLGDDSGLDQATRQDLALSGMAHIFAVSGLHVGYLVLLARALCGRGFRRRKARFFLTAGLLLLYLGLTGWSPSLLRAAVMALLLLASDLFMEEADFISTLSAAALICLSLRPLWLFSAGFQMSFAAVWALYELGPLLCRLLKTDPRSLLGSLAYSLAAVAGVSPLVCYYFFYVPWWGWLLSPLVIAAAGIAVLLCLAGLLASVFWVGLASFFLQGAAWVMQALAAGARLLRSGLGGYAGALPLLWLAIAYALLLAAPLIYRRLQGRAARRPLAASVLAASLLIPLLFSGSSLSRQSPLPHTLAQVTFLDVGQGDSALLITADGYTALIDGGGLPYAPGYVGHQVLLPYLRSLGLDHIDLLINSHPDLDHSDGLVTVLEEMPVGALIYSAGAEEEENEPLLQAAAENGCRLLAASSGCEYQLGGEAELRIFSPVSGRTYEDGNAASVVMMLELGELELLFCGDAPAYLLSGIADEQDLGCGVVKLPHHGSADGFDTDLYQSLDAELAVISVGAENGYGHSDRSVVEYWQDRGELYRTDVDGAITLYTDGSRYAVVTER